MDPKHTDDWYAARDVSSTFIKGLSVLAAFTESQATLTLPEIGKATGLDRAAVRRLVITLVDQGMIEKSGKRFSLTPKILTLGASYLRGNAVGAVVQPILDHHSQELGREIALAALSDGAVVLVAQSHMSGAAVSFGFTVGSRLPLMHTALGRMLLAYAPPTQRETAISLADMARYTADSMTDRAAIADAVSVAQDQGFALVRGEFESGISGLAVPVGRLGVARRAIGVSGPAAAFEDPAIRATCVETLQLCAQALDRAETGAG